MFWEEEEGGEEREQGIPFDFDRSHTPPPSPTPTYMRKKQSTSCIQLKVLSSPTHQEATSQYL